MNKKETDSLVKKINGLLKENKTSEAFALVDNRIENTNEKGSLAVLFRIRGRLSRMYNNLNDAEYFYLRELNYLKELPGRKHRKEKVILLRDLSEVLRFSRSRPWRKYLLEIIELEEEEPTLDMKSRREILMEYADLGDPQESEKYYRRALDLLEEDPDVDSKSAEYYNLALNYTKTLESLGREKEAEEKFLELLQITVSLDQDRKTAEVLSYLRKLLGRRKERPVSEGIKKMVNIMEKARLSYPYSPDWREVQEEIAALYLLDERYEEAGELLRAARKPCERYGGGYKITPHRKMKSAPFKAGGKRLSKEYIKEGNTEEIKKELNSGARISTWSLTSAIYYENRRSVEFLLQKGADINAVCPVYTPLMFAIEYEDTEMIKFLLKRGADPGKESTNGYTSLIYACSENRFKKVIIDLLLENGAEINTVSKKGKTALAAAVHSNNPGKVKYLLKKGAEVTPVALSAVVWGPPADREIAELLLEKSEIPSPDSDEGRLIISTLSRWEEAIELLELFIDHGLNVNTLAEDTLGTDSRGTPLSFACIADNHRGAELLLKKGADPEKKNSLGDTPLLTAVKNDSLNSAEVLLRHGASLEAKDKTGRMPLQAAGTLYLMRKLLEKYMKRKNKI